MNAFTSLLNQLPPVVRLGILLMAAGAAYLLVISLQQQSGELVRQTKRSF